jgi:pimeloyl-ACP methyl ester carboxylesterase
MTTSSFFPFRSAQAKAEYHALYEARAKRWPVALETKLLETPSAQTFIRISGQPTDPPLILLPGARGTSLTWIPNIAALSAHYRTYALDTIYDFGLSVRRGKVTKPEHLINWLDEVLTAIVPQGSVNLVGLSYGGWLASQYALRFPQRVHKLILISPAVTVLPVSFMLILRAILSTIPFTPFRRQFYYWLLNDTVQSGETGRFFVDEAVADWEVAERCFAPLPLINVTLLSDTALKDFKVSTLFLVGENEKIYSARKAVERLNRVAPQIKTEIIPNAGHDAWFVQAEVVNKEMLEFLGDPEIVNRFVT